MTHYDIVKKLIGEIKPIGDSREDEDRFKNLESVCNLVHALILDIDEVAFWHSNSHAHSLKRAGEYAKNFLTERVELK